ARNIVGGSTAVGTFGGSMQHISKLISPFGTGYLDTDVALEDNPMIGIYCPNNSVSMTTGETMIGVRDGSGNEMSLNVDATGISGIYNGGTQHWTVGDTSMRGAYCLNVTPSGSDKE